MIKPDSVGLRERIVAAVEERGSTQVVASRCRVSVYGDRLVF
jgi:hypothetical protein